VSALSWTGTRRSEYLERVSDEQPSARFALEIKALVEQELARISVLATLRLDGESLVLRRGSHESRADIRGTLAQWDSLPDDLRERRARQIAALLVGEGPVAAPQQPIAPPRQPRGLRWFSVFAPISIAGITAAAIALAYHFLAPRGAGPSLFASTPSVSSSSTLGSVPDPDRERTILAGTACEQTRTRVARGANVGPADSEGWVVELVLLRRGAPADLSLTPGLSKFISRVPGAKSGTLSWAPASHLRAVQRFDAEVAVSPSAPLGSGQVSGLSLVFSGPYVVPYFSEEQRGDYFMLADALAEELSATDGALFAHCANSESHHIGSWFLGSTPGRAVSSLVYFMASYSNLPVLKPNVLGALAGPPQRGHTFDAISDAASSMDRSAAATLIGRELGMISGRPEHATRLTFPFRDANRAQRASLDAARALQLANSG